MLTHGLGRLIIGSSLTDPARFLDFLLSEEEFPDELPGKGFPEAALSEPSVPESELLDELDFLDSPPSSLEPEEESPSLARLEL